MTNEQSGISENPVQSGVVILCAEEHVRDVIGYWLSALPTRTFIADDGYHANRILRETRCSLLVTDRVLPPWPGLDTFLALRQGNPKLRIAVVENGTPDERALARVAGATILLPRPLQRRSVVEALTVSGPRS